jgi:hypothetical protein
MSAWKKIAVVCGLSLTAALFGVACTAEVEEAADPVEMSEDLSAADAPADAPLAESSALTSEDSRCERGCYREYRRCERVHNRYERERCWRRYRRCLDICEHRD